VIIRNFLLDCEFFLAQFGRWLPLVVLHLLEHSELLLNVFALLEKLRVHL
jgi:hypothetical protein